MVGHNLELPFEFQDLEPELNSQLIKLSPVQRDGFLRVGPKGYLLPQAFKRWAHQYYNMALRGSDVFVMGYPRSGTNWTQELVWLIVNDLNFATANSVDLIKRTVLFDRPYNVHPILQAELRKSNCDNASNMEYLNLTFSGPKAWDKLPSQRFFKAHLPISLLPPTLLGTTRVVYVARDPRDVVVSFFHLHKISNNVKYTGDFSQFWKLFINDLVYWSPYFEHVKEAWALRNHQNMLFLFYEDMLRDLPSVVRRVAQFFGKQYTNVQVTQLCEHLSFNNFKNNSQVNGQKRIEMGFYKLDKQEFVRKGKAGGWREVFDAGMRAQADEWIARHLRDTDLRFPSMDTDQLH